MSVLDPKVFGPPGSGSEPGSGPGFSHHHAKQIRKTLISTFLCLLSDLLSLKTYLNVPTISTVSYKTKN
jgi:hypothetical protein